MKRKKPVKKSLLRRITKIHGIITLTMFMLYVVAGSLVDPGILISDLGKKYSWATTGISARVMGIPTVPNLSGNTDCSGTSARVNLVWSQAQDADHYDVYRNSELLVGGIAGFTYQDINVQTETSYDYTVMASGPLGEVLSNSITITTGDCVYIPPAPSCDIRTFAGIDLLENFVEPETTMQTPTISGTTNITNANMRLEIVLAGMSVATGIANSNGYWTLTVPVALNIGEHTALITATDPLDSSRFKTIVFNFRIKAEPIIDDGDNNGDDDNDEHSHNKKTDKSVTQLDQQKKVIPAASDKLQFEMNVVIQNKDGIAYPGGLLLTNINFTEINNNALKKPARIEYGIWNMRNRIFSQTSDLVTIKLGELVKKNINLPENLPLGKYILHVKAEIDGVTVSVEKMFTVSELPIVNLGGITITKTDVINNIGLVAYGMLLLLIVFLILLAIERYLMIGAWHIAEQQLRDAGFIKRKGVSQ